MTWGRYDDGWTDRPIWQNVDHASRWHLVCLVQFCCRTERWDGRIPLATARRLSDVDDPDLALDMLVAAKLIKVRKDTLTVVEIESHIPPEYLRSADRKKRQNERQKASRERTARHNDGDHSTCLPDRCAYVQVVTRNVTRDKTRDNVTRDNDGDPGRVGSGSLGFGQQPQQDLDEPTNHDQKDDPDWWRREPDAEATP